MNRKYLTIMLTVATGIALLSGCKKDRGGAIGDAPRLTGIAMSNNITVEFARDAQNRLVQVMNYASYEDSYYELKVQYDSETRGELVWYNVEYNIVVARAVLELDDEGRVIEADVFASPDFNDIALTIRFSYEASGQLAGYEYTYFVPTHGRGHREYTYDDEGNLLKRVYIQRVGEPDEYISEQTDYTPGHMPMPVSWTNDLVMMLPGFGDDNWLLDLFSADKHRRLWDDEGNLTRETEVKASSLEMDGNGWLVSQTFTSKRRVPPQPEIVTNVKYTYAH